MKYIETEAQRAAAAPADRADRAAKRQAWEALKRECPEFIDDVHEIAGRFGIAGVTVQAGGETVAWGDPRGHEE